MFLELSEVVLKLKNWKKLEPLCSITLSFQNTNHLTTIFKGGQIFQTEEAGTISEADAVWMAACPKSVCTFQHSWCHHSYSSYPCHGH